MPPNRVLAVSSLEPPILRACKYFKIRKTRYRATRKSPPTRPRRTSLPRNDTNKPVPPAESGQMPAGEDEVTTSKPDPHDATESGRMPADEDEVTTTKPAPMTPQRVAGCQPARTRG